MKQLRPHNSLLAVLIALATVGAGVGCGGSDARELSTTSMTKAEFADQVEAICSRGRREALRYRSVSEGELQGDALIATIQDTLLPSIAEAIEEIYELGAPADEMEQTETLLVAMQRGVDRGEGLESPTVEKIEDLFAPSGRLARKAGLVSCIYG